MRRQLSFYIAGITETREENTSGRYEMEQGHYFCSGSPVEVLATDGDTGVTCWVRTSVEHNGKD